MNEQPVKTGKKLSATQIILIAGIVVIVAAIAVVGWLLLRDKSEEAAPGNGSVLVDERNARDVMAEIDRQVRDGMYDVSMNTLWNFPEGSTAPSPDSYAANSATNTRPVTLTIQLEDGTALYTSPVIPVGSAVEKVALEKELDPGSYDAVCTYNLLNDDGSAISSVSLTLQLQVAQ